MKQRLSRVLATSQLANEKGASMVEYALLAALIAVGAIGSVSGLGFASRDTFLEVGGVIDALAAGGVVPVGGPPPPPF